MGDAPLASSGRQLDGYSDHNGAAIDYQSHGKALTAPSEQSRGPQAPFYSQMETLPHATPRGPPSVVPYAQYQPQPSMHQLDMSSVAAALPDGSSSPSARAFQQNTQFARGVPAQSPTMMNFPPQHMPQYRNQPPFPNAFPVHPQHVQAHPHAVPNHYYGSYGLGSQMAMRHPSSQGYDPSYATMYGRPEVVAHQLIPQSYPGLVGRDLVSESTPYPRGPPRKPKQSGHALWVGNLPPGTTITSLKDHFSREATKDIESLFLISKSNCAFVNYRTEEACAAAMNRFHDSRFHGLRLVCRLRRGTASAVVPVTQPQQCTDSPENTRKESVEAIEKPAEVVIVASSSPVKEEKVANKIATETAAPVTSERVPERYFVVKSLTLQDLEASVRNGVWSTQGHNEASLNNAFKSADNVYLIFSANKSGEYFGYARMTSNIATDPVTVNPKAQPEQRDTGNGPKSIPTPATQWAPKGRIVDDSARGTIFWEADSSDMEDGIDGHVQPQEEPAGPKQGQDWGKPFAVEWLSTNRLPFYRTRGLRNPWNENREVKIARDGTEIEPGIGQRLVQMFHRPAQAPQNLPHILSTMPTLAN